MRVLLVEDEARIASFISRGLKEENYEVDVSPTGEDGLFMARENPYDLIILDVMLPDKNGFFICRELRNAKISTPVLMLTSRSTVKDKVTGLDAGADDYLTKPFAFEEFLARVRALCRKRRVEKTTLLKIMDLELDQITHKVKRAGKEIELTPKEYSLLEFLMLHANEVVTRTMIAEKVWNEDFDSFSNVFDVYLYRLREKIDKGSRVTLLHSVRGVGYVLKET